MHASVALLPRSTWLDNTLECEEVTIVASSGFVDSLSRRFDQRPSVGCLTRVATAVEEGTIAGPRILAAGHPIMIPGGHGDYYDFPSTLPLNEFYVPLNGFVNSPADAEEAVHLQIKYGARVIKMFASGGVGSPLDSPDAEQLSPEEMKVIVEQAHMAQLKVAAHGESRKAILDALHAGIDSLEHASDLDKEAIGYMKTHGVWWVPTVHIVDTIAAGTEAAPDYEVRKGKALAAKHFASFKLGLQNGLTAQLVAGSDMKYEPGGGSLLDEMIAMVKYGATPQQALAAATKNGASLAGWGDMGTLEVGKEADFVALEGDPIRDIAAVKKTKYVVPRTGGRFTAVTGRVGRDRDRRTVVTSTAHRTPANRVR